MEDSLKRSGLRTVDGHLPGEGREGVASVEAGVVAEGVEEGAGGGVGGGVGGGGVNRARVTSSSTSARFLRISTPPP